MNPLRKRKNQLFLCIASLFIGLLLIAASPIASAENPLHSKPDSRKNEVENSPDKGGVVRDRKILNVITEETIEEICIEETYVEEVIEEEVVYKTNFAAQPQKEPEDKRGQKAENESKREDTRGGHLNSSNAESLPRDATVPHTPKENGLPCRIPQEEPLKVVCVLKSMLPSLQRPTYTTVHAAESSAAEKAVSKAAEGFAQAIQEFNEVVEEMEAEARAAMRRRLYYEQELREAQRKRSGQT